MRTINVLTQSGHIDFSLQLLSVILGIYYLPNIHLGADIDLYIYCDRFYCSFFILLLQTHPHKCIP